jgi:hypothetical protein
VNWTELLKTEIEDMYKATEGLIDLVDEDQLDWKPPTGENWMSMGQLLRHISDACGAPIRGFCTGEWGMPSEAGSASAGVEMSDMPPEEMIPPAEKLPTVGSVDEARRLLAADKELALQTLVEAGEERLAEEACPAPWDPTEMLLGHRLLSMAYHLGSHKAQLFYCLKLQGKPVNTRNLWGE